MKARRGFWPKVKLNVESPSKSILNDHCYFPLHYISGLPGINKTWFKKKNKKQLCKKLSLHLNMLNCSYFINLFLLKVSFSHLVKTDCHPTDIFLMAKFCVFHCSLPLSTTATAMTWMLKLHGSWATQVKVWWCQSWMMESRRTILTWCRTMWVALPE